MADIEEIRLRHTVERSQRERLRQEDHDIATLLAEVEELTVLRTQWRKDLAEMRIQAKRADDAEARLARAHRHIDARGGNLSALRKTDTEIERLRAVANEAKMLRDSGYDGAFIGSAVVPLFAALRALDSQPIEEQYTVAEDIEEIRETT